MELEKFSSSTTNILKQAVKIFMNFPSPTKSLRKKKLQIHQINQTSVRQFMMMMMHMHEHSEERTKMHVEPIVR